MQDCVHAYMRKRRKTEAKEKAEELESTRLRVATDNLAVLAQVTRACESGLGLGSRSWFGFE